MSKKKTYVFDQDTLNILEALKRDLGKKETQILKEALRLYMEHHKGMSAMTTTAQEFLKSVENLTKHVSDLSYRLGRCEAEKERLKSELDRLRSR